MDEFDRDAVINEFGRRLREMRELRGLSIWQLAAQTGIPPDTIRRDETGESKQGPPISRAMRLAAALGVELVELLPPEVAA